MKRKKEGERRRRELFIPLGNSVYCLPRLTSKNPSFAERRTRVSNETWRLAPSDSVKSFVTNVKLWSHWDECVGSI